MPGVKKLHQESANVGKPEWIRGHYFSALGLLLGQGSALFVAPLMLKLHDGIDTGKLAAPPSLVDKMATQCVNRIVPLFWMPTMLQPSCWAPSGTMGYISSPVYVDPPWPMRPFALARRLRLGLRLALWPLYHRPLPMF